MRLEAAVTVQLEAAAECAALRNQLDTGRTALEQFKTARAAAEAAATEATAAHVAAAGLATSLEHQLGSMAELHERECQRLAKTTEVGGLGRACSVAACGLLRQGLLPRCVRRQEGPARTRFRTRCLWCTVASLHRSCAAWMGWTGAAQLLVLV
jgi:hypothetical protein